MFQVKCFVKIVIIEQIRVFTTKTPKIVMGVEIIFAGNTLFALYSNKYFFRPRLPPATTAFQLYVLLFETEAPVSPFSIKFLI